MLRNKLIFSAFLTLISTVVFSYFQPANYDLNHNNQTKQSYSIDAWNRITQSIDHQGNSTQFSYDLNHNIQTEQRFTGEIIHYNYDERDRLTGIQSNETGFTQLNYYPDNNLHSINYANGVIAALSYDNKGQLLELQHSADGENLYQVSYEYDSHGNKTKRFDQWENEHRMQMFMYNAEDWLLKHSTLNDQHIYYYTPTGNRASYKLVQGDNNDVIAHQQYHYNTRDQLVQIEDLLDPANNIDYTYDENGNQLSKTQNGATTNYTYNGKNRLRNITVGNNETSYFYDHLGRRIQSQSNNEQIRFHYNLNDQLVAETNQLNDVIRTYNHGNNFQLSGKSDNDTFYYHTDDLGSPNIITNPNKELIGTYQYLPFGDKTVLQGLEDNPIGFTGYYLDNESDQYYAQQRYYNQYSGMFNREDPVEGDFNSPLSLNRYVYANNNPLIYVDPNGEKSLSTTLRDAELDCQSGMCVFGYRFLSNVYTVGTLGFASIHDPAKDDYDAGKISSYDYAASLAGGLGVTAFSIATLGTGSGLIAGATTTAGKIGTSALVGGSVTGAQNAVKQSVELAASRRDSFDTGELLIETGVGTAFGGGTAASVQALRAAKNVFKVKSVIIDEGGKSLEPVITQVNGNKGVTTIKYNRKSKRFHDVETNFFVSRDEAIKRGEIGALADFMADKGKFFHSTSKVAVEPIIKGGFRTDIPNPQAAFHNNRFGRGVYLAESPQAALAERPGGIILNVKTDINRNLNIVNRGPIIDSAMGKSIGRGAKKHGFDSITTQSVQPNGGINIIILDPNKAKAIGVMQ